MRNNKTKEKPEQKHKNVTKMSQILPGEGLSEGLMDNSGDSARDSARDSWELREELRNSRSSYHPFCRTQGGLGAGCTSFRNVLTHLQIDFRRMASDSQS